MEGVAVLREVLTAYDVTAVGRGPAQGPQHHQRAAPRRADPRGVARRQVKSPTGWPIPVPRPFRAASQ